MTTDWSSRIAAAIGWSYRLFCSYSADTLTIWRVVHATQDTDDCALVDLADYDVAAYAAGV